MATATAIKKAVNSIKPNPPLAEGTVAFGRFSALLPLPISLAPRTTQVYALRQQSHQMVIIVLPGIIRPVRPAQLFEPLGPVA